MCFIFYYLLFEERLTKYIGQRESVVKILSYPPLEATFSERRVKKKVCNMYIESQYKIKIGSVYFHNENNRTTYPNFNPITLYKKKKLKQFIFDLYKKSFKKIYKPFFCFFLF